MTQTTPDPPEPAEPTSRVLGTVRVDDRGRVYFKRVSPAIAPGSVYIVDAVDEPAPSAQPETDAIDDDNRETSKAVPAPPKTIRMRLVE